MRLGVHGPSGGDGDPGPEALPGHSGGHREALPGGAGIFAGHAADLGQRRLSARPRRRAAGDGLRASQRPQLHEKRQLSEPGLRVPALGGGGPLAGELVPPARPHVPPPALAGPAHRQHRRRLHAEGRRPAQRPHLTGPAGGCVPLCGLRWVPGDDGPGGSGSL